MLKMSRLILILILLKLTNEQTLDVSDYDIYGSRFTLNEYISVLATNDEEEFIVYYSPYESSGCIQSIDYIYPNQFIYSVSIGSKQNSTQRYFAYIGEYQNTSTTTTSQVIFGIRTVTYCNNPSGYDRIIDLNNQYQRKSVIGIDPYGMIVFIVCPTMIFRYDINNGTYQEWSISYTYQWQYSPRSIVIDENQVVHTVGYYCLLEFYCYIQFFKIIYYSQSFSLQLHMETIGDNSTLPGTLYLSNNSIDDMSLSINTYLKLILIGISYLDQIFIYHYSSNINQTYLFNSTLTYYQTEIGFGKSVTWITNETIAILSYSLSTFPWAKSQIQVYYLNDIVNSNISYPYPYSTYPNNQQNYQISSHSITKTFSIILSWNENSLAVLTDDGEIYFIPSNSLGYCSSKVQNLFYPLKINVYFEDICIIGTYKNDSMFGPCLICPTNTKNNGSSSIECSNCLNNSFCPLGSINDLNNNDLMNDDELYPYPESQELINYEDILINRIFSFGSSKTCLVVSPLFWACVVFGLIILIVIIMGILRFCPKQKKTREMMKRVLSSLDLIGEGEIWIGGLLSLVVCVLIIFSYVFGNHFVSLYPIENLPDDQTSFLCDSSMINSQFSTELQFLSVKKNEDEKEIFDLLDSQQFTLTIELINTGFTCNDLTLEQDHGATSPSIKLKSFNCSMKLNNSSLVISNILSNHQIELQYNLTGPYFIGGLKICFYGNGQTNDVYTLQQLYFCQFFSTEDQSLSNSPSINVEITKIINRTRSLDGNNRDRFSGIWSPTINIYPLSDLLLYQQNGDYLRYLNYRTILIVNIEESSFYVQNIQQPIIKEAELIFQSVLFTTLCLELFGLFFLIVKLLFLPIIQLIREKLSKKPNKVNINETHIEPDENNESLQIETIEKNAEGRDAIMANTLDSSRFKSVW